MSVQGERDSSRRFFEPASQIRRSVDATATTSTATGGEARPIAGGEE